ncbi:hypothetical protein CLF_101480 [Clonorchis sinensis]|uniref:Uncharacterized protein n=1 Tax=Clonorchis sinensis TaxID=79923 RepID=G7Y5U8_CLOSI|nr:hypothetical protein CLF_101480 [Clonorchis sinensis]
MGRCGTLFKASHESVDVNEVSSVSVELVIEEELVEDEATLSDDRLKPWNFQPYGTEFSVRNPGGLSILLQTIRLSQIRICVEIKHKLFPIRLAKDQSDKLILDAIYNFDVIGNSFVFRTKELSFFNLCTKLEIECIIVTTVVWRDTDPRTPNFASFGLDFQWDNYETWKIHIAYCEYGGLLPTRYGPQEYRSDFLMSIGNFIQFNAQFFGCYRVGYEPSIIACTLKVSCFVTLKIRRNSDFNYYSNCPNSSLTWRIVFQLVLDENITSEMINSWGSAAHIVIYECGLRDVTQFYPTMTVRLCRMQRQPIAKGKLREKASSTMRRDVITWAITSLLCVQGESQGINSNVYYKSACAIISILQVVIKIFPLLRYSGYGDISVDIELTEIR